MTGWAGWSTDQQQVDQTRVLARLLATAVNGITEPPQSVIAALGVTASVNGNRFADALDFDHHLVTPGFVNGGGRGIQPVHLNAAGRALVEEFRQAAGRRTKAPAARRAVLLWLYEHESGSMADLLNHPQSWFYGTQFTVDELSEAATNLDGRGYAKALAVMGGHVLRAWLTPTGTSCVEQFDGNPDQMEAPPMTSGQQFHIGSYTQQGGNSAFGSTVTSQSAITTVTIGQTATDLVGLLEAVKALDGIPDAEQAEADEVAADLQAAAAGTVDPAPAISRARAFFHRLQQFAQPAAQALLTAAGNYAALQLGMPTS